MTIVRNRPVAKGARVCSRAVCSAPACHSSIAALKIALGGAMKIGFICWPKYCHTKKNNSTDIVRIAFGLVIRSLTRVDGGIAGVGTDRRMVSAWTLMAALR